MKSVLSIYLFLLASTTGLCSSSIEHVVIYQDTLGPGADRLAIGVQILGPEGIYGATFTALRFTSKSKYEKIYFGMGATEELCIFCADDDMWEHRAISVGKFLGLQKGIVAFEFGLIGQLWIGIPEENPKKFGLGFGPVANLSISPKDIRFLEFYFGVHLVGNTFMFGENSPFVLPVQIGLRHVWKSEKARRLER